jgi:hypothetical protein
LLSFAASLIGEKQEESFLFINYFVRVAIATSAKSVDVTASRTLIAIQETLILDLCPWNQILSLAGRYFAEI